MIRIVLTGAESSGKSTLAIFLGRELGLPVALEYARAHLEREGPGYDYQTVHKIARGHLAHQAREVPPDAPLGIFDTDLLNFQIWCELAYGRCEPWLAKQAAAETRHRYLLCRPDIPWQPDPLREYPEGREWLFEKHLAAVRSSGRDYELVEGRGPRRRANALAAARKLISRAAP